MSDLEKQKKLTDGKGWSLVKAAAKTAVDTLTPTTVKKVREKIQKSKDKKKRGPRDE
jgi:hypothetical protein